VFRIVAVTGHAGAGKSTAISYCQSLGLGDLVYVGQFVVDEVVARKLPLTPENERKVRLELRKQHGEAYLASLAVRKLETERLDRGVLIDAVLSIEELFFYQRRFGSDFQLLAIHAEFWARADRLSSRQTRSMTRDELQRRDELEIVNLRTDTVIRSASLNIENNGSLDEFHAALRQMASRLAQTSQPNAGTE
jgi:dephospho-CoA kinase